VVTIQYLVVDKTERRLICSHNENLETHFINIPILMSSSFERIENGKNNPHAYLLNLRLLLLPNSNVLVKVSAMELKAEGMVKLSIILTEN
jgi:hypothetical protein